MLPMLVIGIGGYFVGVSVVVLGFYLAACVFVWGRAALLACDHAGHGSLIFVARVVVYVRRWGRLTRLLFFCIVFRRPISGACAFWCT